MRHLIGTREPFLWKEGVAAKLARIGHQIFDEDPPDVRPHRPTAGEVAVLGTRIRVGVRSALARVDCPVETATAYSNLTVCENLEIQRRLTRLPVPCCTGSG